MIGVLLEVEEGVGAAAGIKLGFLLIIAYHAELAVIIIICFAFNTFPHIYSPQSNVAGFHGEASLDLLDSNLVISGFFVLCLSLFF